MIPQINLTQINWKRVLPYIVILVLSAILFSTCNNNNEALLVLNDKIKESDLKQQKYVERINSLNDSLVLLERLKQREKLIIKTVIKEIKAKTEIVNNLTTKGIANYYQERYKLPILITQYGVALKDTIAKLNIIELVQKDGLVLELNHTKNIIAIEEKKGIVKDSIIVNKDSIITEKDVVIKTHLDIEYNLNKSIKSEKIKKNIWKLTAFGILTGATYLLIK